MECYIVRLLSFVLLCRYIMYSECSGIHLGFSNKGVFMEGPPVFLRRSEESSVKVRVEILCFVQNDNAGVGFEFSMDTLKNQKGRR